jgi:hypothetical protein
MDDDVVEATEVGHFSDFRINLAKVVLGSLAGYLAQAATHKAIDSFVDYRRLKAIKPGD